MFRTLRFAAVAALIAGSMFLAGHQTSANLGANISVIVELRDDPGAIYAAKAKQNGTTLTDDQVQAYRNGLTAAQAQFLNALTSSGISAQAQSLSIKGYDGNVAATVPLGYTLVYNGITLSVPESAVPAIKSMPQVKSIHDNLSLCTDLNTSVPYIRADKVYGNPPRLTQFDNLDTGGLEGEGVYVAVIDTGIDWTHEMFGGDPTPPRLAVQPQAAAVNTNQKVIYSLPMADTVTDGFGHGTHVASTIAGYNGFAPHGGGLAPVGSDTWVHGVAPQAKLMTYKVCSDSLSTVGAVGGPVGGCLTSSIMLALEDAVSPRTLNGLPKPVAHVINMSLGGGGGPDNPTAVASDNAVIAGAIVVAAAGNSGPAEGTLGAPAAGRRVIAVAANTDPGSNANWSTDVLAASAVSPTQTGSVTPASNLPLAQGQRNQIALFPMAGTPAPPSGSMAQYCVFVRNGQTLDEWPTNASGRIALVKLTNPRIPQTLFAQVANNGAAAGAVAVLFVSSTQTPTAVKATIPAANILPDDGRYLESLMPGGSATTDPANGAVSAFPIRINPFFGTSFVGQMAGFSSRGPVQGYGQVKPDVSAPGVNILAAMPPASTLGALSGGNYGRISGTSMATPHTAGAAALIRQAHPSWSPDWVRTALINTATNMRDQSGSPKADASADSINDQGGGLIDVYHAVHAKGLMGVAGDGIRTPSILGSYSFAEVPVVNNRVTSTQSVTVTIQDLSGQGGTYNLAAVDNRDTQLAGIGVSVSPSSVSVPAGGSATFTASATFDGNLNRVPTHPVAVVNGNQVTFQNVQIQMQWYVAARRSDGGESLRMPLYYRPAPSLPSPSLSSSDTKTFTGTIVAGDADNETVQGVTYTNTQFNVDNATTRLVADLDFIQVVGGTFPDLDFYLYDPDGKLVKSSTNSGGPEHIDVAISRGGTYTYRVDGFLNGPTDYTITSTQVKAAATPPVLSQVPGDYVNNAGQHIDFDGSFNLQWSPNGGEQGFEIEQSTDGQNWQIISDVAGNVNSLAVSSLANGTYYFQVHAMYPGQIGLYVTPPSNVVSVLVDQRTQADITSLVRTAIVSGSLAFSGGVWQQDMNLTNLSSNTYVPLLQLKIISISTPGITCINADNGGSGTSAANAALFDYSRQIGSDEQFSPNEVSGARTMKFQDSAGQLFTFDAIVTAYRQVGGGGGSSSNPPSGGGGSGTSGSSSLLPGLTSVLRFTVNPLLKTVTVSLVPINP